MESHDDSELSSSSSSSESESELVGHSSSSRRDCSKSLSHTNLPDHGRDEPSRSQTLGNSGELHPAISSGDFGKVVLLKANRKLTDHKKFIFLTKHFIPPCISSSSCQWL